jgi:UDP-N-acetylmuramoyl-tripeptide--D-alanyl-D-alanine ligase
VEFLTSEVAAATGGEVRGPDVVVSGATIDSRAVRPGQMFVAVVGERDGHDFAASAHAAGAPAVLVSRPGVGGGATEVVVDDTVRALAALGRLARRSLRGPVVGITGSVGKTSTKDLASAVFRTTYRTAAAERSFNNELGVPLTLLEAPSGTEAVVLEKGARGRGHISLLCSIGEPTIGIVTCVGAAHLELFGSLDDVAVAKGELVEALPSTGTAVLNADDHRVAAMATRTDARVLRFGGGGDVRAETVAVDAELRARFRLVTPWGSSPVVLGVAGVHMVANALAAASAGLAAGVPLEGVVAGLSEAALSPWRMEVRRAAGGATIVNDAYNANPLSMRAALDALVALPARRRIAVLGVMAELGDDGAAAHAEVARRASEGGVELIAVGTELYGRAPIAAADVAGALGALGDGDAVLVKGSRVAGLERVAASLLGS